MWEQVRALARPAPLQGLAWKHIDLPHQSCLCLGVLPEGVTHRVTAGRRIIAYRKGVQCP